LLLTGLSVLADAFGFMTSLAVTKIYHRRESLFWQPGFIEGFFVVGLLFGVLGLVRSLQAKSSELPVERKSVTVALIAVCAAGLAVAGLLFAVPPYTRPPRP